MHLGPSPSHSLHNCNNISIQDGIIVIFVLIFYDLLDLLLSEDSFKDREFRTEVGESAGS